MVKAESTKVRMFRTNIASDPRNIRLAEEFLEEINRTAQFDEVEFHKLLVSVTEGVNNAIVHGNRSDPSQTVEVIIELSARKIVAKVRDKGNGFEMGSVPNPIHDENIMKESGRGIFLMCVLADDVSGKHVRGGFELKLTFRRKLHPQKGTAS